MTTESPPRRWPLAALVLIALAAFALRLLGLLGEGGPVAAPTGYDDGVYFSAAGLMVRGVMPYRDFVFVHPPGVAYFYAIPAIWTAFSAARVIAALVGAVNTFLAGAIAMRAAGPFGGIVAAALYALYPDAIVAERSPYIEPVLNLFALGAAFVWLDPRERKSKPLVTAILLAAASATKIWGGMWVLAAALTSRRPRSEVLPLLGWASAAGLLLLAPVALPAPRNFVTQTLLFHAWRPPDGTIDRGVRLAEILHSGHLIATVLAALALLTVVRSREARYFAIVMMLTIAAFLASSTYWTSYNAHLAASQCVMAGLAAGAMTRRENRGFAIATGIVIAALLYPSARDAIRNARGRWPENAAVGRAIDAAVPTGEQVFAFDPTWTLAARRLPPHGDGAPVVVDSYGAMLLAAVDGGRTFTSADAAFASEAAQRDVRARLEASPWAIFGERGSWQMRGATRVWAESHFLCVEPAGDDLCVSRRLARPLSGEGFAFGDGWYGEEGSAPDTWRWMAARSVTSLPPGGGRLQLVFWVPLRELGEPPEVTIAIDARTVDRFRPNRSTTVRSYAVDAGARTLVISTSRTFNPAEKKLSSDARDLGLSLRQIALVRGGAFASTSSPP